MYKLIISAYAILPRERRSDTVFAEVCPQTYEESCLKKGVSFVSEDSLNIEKHSRSVRVLVL